MSKRKKGKKNRSLAGTLVLVVLLVIVGFQVVRVFGRISSARAEEASLNAQIQHLQKENEVLESDLNRSDDPSFYQELARSELGLTKKGERIFYDVNN